MESSTPSKSALAWNIGMLRWYARRREHPSKRELVVRRAVLACHLKVLDWQYLIETQPGIFCAVTAGVEINGAPALIHLIGMPRPVFMQRRKLHWRILETRRNFAFGNHIPYMELIAPMPQIEYEARIELWKLTIKIKPYRIITDWDKEMEVDHKPMKMHFHDGGPNSKK